VRRSSSRLSFTKFDVADGTMDMFLKFEFEDDGSMNCGAVMVRNSRFPLTKLSRHTAYTTACC